MKTFLLVVDLQKGFIVDGVNDAVTAGIDGLIGTGAFDRVISTVYYNYENSPISRLMGWNNLYTAEEQAVIGLAAERSDHFVRKNIYSAYSEQLAGYLRGENNGETPECVFIAGVDTECCVLMTAADFFEAGIRPIVLSRYCASSGGEDAHLAGIRAMDSLIGRNNICHTPIHTRQDLENALDAARNTVCDLSAPSKEARLVKLLSKKGWRISFAESCTGGKAAARLVGVPSASGVFDASFVAYANEPKIEYLGVSSDTLETHGVVSEEVAVQMAEGTAKAAGSQVGVGISGIAGPTGATPGKPVGMVCFGFYVDGKIFPATKQFGAIGRNAVRNASVEFVYDTLLEILGE